MILVTGSTGNVGSELIKCLINQKANIKAAISNNSSAKKIQKGIRTVIFDFENPETFEEALKDIDRVFLMRPPQMGDPKQIYPFIDACKKLGIKHIVFLSLLGIQFNPFAPHGHIEKYTKKSGITYTLLRPSFFMQNLSTTHCKHIKDCNEVFVPAGKGKTSFIDVRDIAGIAAKVLTEKGHENKAYDLTGSEALNYGEIAEILSKVTGKSITYRNPSSKEFVKRMAKEGFSPDFINVMKNIYMINKIGLAGKVTNTVEKILGRRPITFKKFAKDNKELFI